MATRRSNPNASSPCGGAPYSNAFIRNPNPGKRGVLVNNLLARNNDYAQHWLTFWNDALPDTVDGPGAESFAQFITRVENTLAKLETFQTDARVLVFCHAQFMQAMRWVIECRPLPLMKSHLQELRHLDLTAPIKNCQGYRHMRSHNEWKLD